MKIETLLGLGLAAVTSVVETLKPGEPAPQPVPVAESPANATVEGAPGSGADLQLRMNFRGVPLEAVLNYLSEAAGFTIILETRLEGKIDAWSNQPLNKAE